MRCSFPKNARTQDREDAMTSEQNLADLKRAAELLARLERRRQDQFALALTCNFAELDKLNKDYEDERNGDWAR